MINREVPINTRKRAPMLPKISILNHIVHIKRTMDRMDVRHVI